MRRLVSIILPCTLCLGAASTLAGSAAAAGLAPAVADCNAHGQLTRTYTVQQLQRALATMPADIKEYTGCYNVIDRQLLADLGKLKRSGGSGSGGGSFLPTWLIIVLALLVLGGAAFGVVALRQRGEDAAVAGHPGGSGPPPYEDDMQARPREGQTEPLPREDRTEPPREPEGG